MKIRAGYKRGVCRDFAHLAITLCRCVNIPARYCTGYLGDIGVPIDPSPMDFSAWFEVYLGNRRYTFDARHNKPRIGRILMARGRDVTGRCHRNLPWALHALGIHSHHRGGHHTVAGDCVTFQPKRRRCDLRQNHLRTTCSRVEALVE
jgi:hypothetical protein